MLAESTQTIADIARQLDTLARTLEQRPFESLSPSERRDYRITVALQRVIKTEAVRDLNRVAA